MNISCKVDFIFVYLNFLNLKDFLKRIEKEMINKGGATLWPKKWQLLNVFDVEMSLQKVTIRKLW